MSDLPPVTGLTTAEVQARVAAGQTNVTPRPGGRSTWDIVRTNVFTWFNLILGVLFVFMVTFGSWRDALFGIVIVVNALIGIAQELRAKIALDKLSLLTAPAAHVIRDGSEYEIPVAEVVLDDVLRITAGDQVVADGETLDSQGMEVDESLLTGESAPVAKASGDRLLSGSFVVAGGGLFRATAVGADAYAQRLAGEGKRYARLHSDLMQGINGILRVVGSAIVPVGALMVWAQFRMGAGMGEGVTNTVAALVAMVPQGLVLLTSIAFAVSAITLARRNVLTRELPAVEGLARVDVLCIDKTGTITEPRPAFERFELLPGGDGRLGGAGGVGGGAGSDGGGGGGPVCSDGGRGDSGGGDGDDSPREARARDVLGAMAAGASSHNATLLAIQAAIPAPESWVIEDAVSFSSARKWSAARFTHSGSWVLGAPEVVGSASVGPAGDMARARAARLAEEGLRVLLLAHTDDPLSGELLPPGLAPVGLVVLSERIRSDAAQTLAYFREQGVQIKVISGDSPATVATIAGKAGVTGAELAVDSRFLPGGEALSDLLEKTTVFGRVDPDQKSAMVQALQSRGHVVAMTGDGVNDVLALKKADLGIAMGTGTAAAQAVAQLVLVDSRFSTLPGVVAEGRRVTANIERVAHLFTTKTVWAAVLALAVAAVTVSYPLLPRQITLMDALAIGIPSFFLALAPNPRRYIAGFVRRVARFVLPTGLLAAFVVLVSYLLIRKVGASVDEARTMETVIFSVVGLRVIAAVERPVRGWRLGLLLSMAALLALAFAVPFARSFFALDLPGWPAVGITVAAAVVAWFFVGLGWRIGRRLPLWRNHAG